MTSSYSEVSFAIHSSGVDSKKDTSELLKSNLYSAILRGVQMKLYGFSDKFILSKCIWISTKNIFWSLFFLYNFYLVGVYPHPQKSSFQDRFLFAFNQSSKVTKVMQDLQVVFTERTAEKWFPCFQNRNSTLSIERSSPMRKLCQGVALW